MISIDVLSRKVFSEGKMQKVNLFETGNLFCDIYCLMPGQSQKPHSHTGADKIYYVLEGDASIQVGGEVQVVKPGQIVLAPSGAEHGVTNASGNEVTLLVMMAPNPNVQKTT
jgi:quercetin dioxygenase-like cupin family protein